MATRWGVAGTGKVCNDFVTVVKGLANEEHEFVAVGSRNLSSAQSFASTHGIPKSHGSYEELARDKEVEVVYVGSINSEHFRLGKLMLENGKHVLMEKPMTMNSKQTKILIEIARSNKRLLVEALWSRFLPSYKCLMNVVKEGSIGDIVHVESNFGANVMYERRRVTKASGIGILFDMGIYPLNAVSMVYNNEKPSKVAAVGHLNKDGIDVSLACCLQYGNNRTANITSNGMATLPGEMVITGTKGRIKVPKSMNSSLTIETPDKTYTFKFPELDVRINFPNSIGFIHEAKEVRECLKNGLLESPVLPHKDSLLLAEIMDEIRSQIGLVDAEGKTSV